MHQILLQTLTYGELESHGRKHYHQIKKITGRKISIDAIVHIFFPFVIGFWVPSGARLPIRAADPFLSLCMFLPWAMKMRW